MDILHVLFLKRRGDARFFAQTENWVVDHFFLRGLGVCPGPGSDRCALLRRVPLQALFSGVGRELAIYQPPVG